MSLFAYIDPFTGSLVLQALAAAFFGIVAFFKPIMTAVRAFFGSKKVDSDPHADEINE